MNVSHRYRALALLMAIAFLNYLDRSLLFPVMPLLAKTFHLTETLQGALSTGFYVVYALSAPLCGYLSDRISRRTLLLIALIGWSCVTAASGLATGFISLLLWRSLTGLGEGAYFPTAISLIGDLFAPSERGRAIALHGIATTLGGAAGYALGGVIGEHLGWRAPFFLALFPGLLMAAIFARTFADPKRGMSDQKESAPIDLRARSYAAIVGSPSVLLISLTACAATFTMNGVNAFLPSYLQLERGISVSAAGILTGLFYALTIVGQFSGGLLGDRLIVRTGIRPMLAAFAYLIVAPAAFFITRSAAIATALACYGVTQIARGFAEPNLYGTVLDTVAPGERGTAQGFLLMMTFVGGSLGPTASGYAIHRFGYRTTIDLLGLSAAVAGACAAILFLFVRRQSPRAAQRDTFAA